MHLKRMSDKNDTFLCKENLTDTILMLAGPEVSHSERSCLSYSASKEDFCLTTKLDPSHKALH